MKNTAQKIHATTQRFTQIEDIIGEVILLSGSQSALVLEVTATNFALQSDPEQESRIYSYAALLNSLSFPIQILIISRQLDITSYLKLLDDESQKASNPSASNQIKMYRDFVAQLVSKNTVLDKKFYIVLSFSALEKGATSVSEGKNKQMFLNDARQELNSKAMSLSQELVRTGLKSRILQKDELIKLFYEVYNPESGGVAPGATGTFVRGIK